MARKIVLKYCRGCEKKKAHSAFGKDSSNKDGLHYLCRDCVNGHYQANRERYRAYRELRAARIRAEEFPDSDADRRRFQKLRGAFERKYGPLEPRPSRKPAAEVMKQRRQKYEEMFMKILEYQKTNPI